MLLNQTRRLPDSIVVDLPPTGSLSQSDDGSGQWPPPFVDTPEEDNYWQNPKPMPEEQKLPPPTQPASPVGDFQGSSSSAPSTMSY